MGDRNGEQNLKAADEPGTRLRVVIGGAGVAGLEALLALSTLAEDRVDLELLSPADEYVYRPMLVAEPFGVANAQKIELERVVRDTAARHTKDTLASLDADARTITTKSGTRVEYDAFLIAVGANAIEAVPGALTFSGEAERRRFAEMLGALGRREIRRLAFVVPPAVTWSIAAYELAFLTAAERDARRLEWVEITLVTHEAAPLDLFGAAASHLVASRLEEAEISLRLSSAAERYEDGQLRLSGDEPLAVDGAVALPALEVSPLQGLPQDENGFVPTDDRMRVAGLDAVWAAGDATSFPIKQGGVAAQQADVAARAIAAYAGADVPIEAFQPVLRGALITGGAPEFLRTPAAGPGAVTAKGRGLWSPPAKVAATYLAPYLGGDSSPELVDIEAPTDPATDEAAHERAMSLVLAAANADARMGDYESAIKWLFLLEQLNFVIPPEYVARRYEWRQELEPDLARDAAAERIDPSFRSAAAAVSDLQRRVGWLREIDHRTEAEARQELAQLDEGMAHLIAVCRRSGVLE